VNRVENVVQKVYNPVPVMTHYNMPVFHHIPINEVVKKYIPVYYPIPIEHKIIIPVKIPIKIPQRVNIIFNIFTYFLIFDNKFFI